MQAVILAGGRGVRLGPLTEETPKALTSVAVNGITLRTAFGSHTPCLRFVADRKPINQGLRVPGLALPIGPPERLKTKAFDGFLLLTWTLAEEIFGELSWFTGSGGKILCPLPAPCLV